MKSQPVFIPLEDVRIADPCRADWNKMQGDERVRFCQTCTKNVYNISSMSRTEAENLIREKEGNLCVRFYQRADGTIITDNCPVGLKLVRRPFKWLATGFAALMAMGVAIVHAENNKPRCANPEQPTYTPPTAKLRNIQPFKTVFDWAEPAPPPIAMAGAISVAPRPPVKNQPTMGKPIMGRIAPAPTPVKPTPTSPPSR